MRIHHLKKHFFLSICFLLISTYFIAQTPENKRADDLFKFKNYRDALTEYVELFKKNTSDDYLSYQIALCYLNLNEDRSIAISFLEPLAVKPNAKSSTYYNLAKAYTYANKFEDALKYFQKAKSLGKIDGIDGAKLERDIETCKNGKELVSKPIQITFENLGPKINTPFTEYSPFISSNESFLIYNSRNDLDGVRKANGLYTSDVYISEVYMGEWQQSKNIGEVVNTKANDEQIIGVSADGLTLLFNYDNTTDGSGDIFVGPKYENDLMKPFKINSTVNSLSVENAATISNISEKKTLQ
jgi:tetratricopeptide (TPR) repeat protein